MSIHSLMVVGAQMPQGERFIATLKTQRGQYFGPGVRTPEEGPAEGVSAEKTMEKILKNAGLLPCALLTEGDMRVRLKEAGLSNEDIEARFQWARKWMTTIS